MPTKTAAKTSATVRSAQATQATQATQGPQAFIPSGEAMALFKGAELGVQAAKKLAEWLQQEGPLVVQVLDARALGRQYLVHFRATNQTVHGMYLLGASLSWPQAITKLPLLKKPEADIAFGAAPTLQPVPLPLRLATATPLDLYIEFLLPSKQHLDAGLWHGRVGKLKLAFQLLNKESADSRPVDFSILLPE
jgi:hypothetical protein